MAAMMSFLDGAEDPAGVFVAELAWVGPSTQSLADLALRKEDAKVEITRARSEDLRARWMIRYLQCVACAASWHRTRISDTDPLVTRDALLELKGFLDLPPQTPSVAVANQSAVLTIEARRVAQCLLQRAVECLEAPTGQ